MYTRSQAVVCACALFAAGAAEAFAASPDGTLFMPSNPSATFLGEDFYVGSGEEAVLGDIYEFASISVEGGTLRSTAAAYVADDIRISAGGRFEMTDLPDEIVYTIADGALRLEDAQVRLAGSRPGADLELATESLHVDGVSEIILECASDAFDKTQSVHASFINGVSLEAGATLDARIGRGTAMSIGAEFSGLPLDNEFKHRDNRYSKGLLVVAAPFELASGMHFNVGSSETAAGENLLLGAEGVLVVTRGDVLSAASEPIFSAADDTTIRFDAGSEIWLSTSCGENIDEALAAIDFGGTDISGLGNVLVSYDGRNGRFELDGDGRYTVRFEPMRFSGPFAGMLETLWVSRHDLLLPGFFRAIYERASAKAGEAALLNASVLASRLGTDERLAHLNERAAGETPFRWLGAAGTGKRDGLYLGTLPLHVAVSACRSEDETGVGGMRGQIRSDNVTAEASGAAAFGAWRVGVGAAGVKHAVVARAVRAGVRKPAAGDGHQPVTFPLGVEEDGGVADIHLLGDLGLILAMGIGTVFGALFKQHVLYRAHLLLQKGSAGLVRHGDHVSLCILLLGSSRQNAGAEQAVLRSDWRDVPVPGGKLVRSFLFHWPDEKRQISGDLPLLYRKTGLRKRRAGFGQRRQASTKLRAQ